MNEMKTMDYQRFNDYWTKLSKPIDLGFFDKQLIAEEIVSIDLAREIFSKNVNISIGIDNQNSQEDIVKLKALSEKYKGDCGLMFHFKQTTGRSQRVFAHNIKVNTSNDFLKECRDIFGSKNIWITD